MYFRLMALKLLSTFVTICAATSPETMRIVLSQQFFNGFASEFIAPILENIRFDNITNATFEMKDLLSFDYNITNISFANA